MVTPAARREAVAQLREHHEVSERRRFGYRRLGLLLSREGKVLNHKKLPRTLRPSGGKKGLTSVIAPLCEFSMAACCFIMPEAVWQIPAGPGTGCRVCRKTRDTAATVHVLLMASILQPILDEQTLCSAEMLDVVRDNDGFQRESVARDHFIECADGDPGKLQLRP
jgi:hypothetical protein